MAIMDSKIEVKPAHTLASISLMPSNIKFANQNPEEQVVLFIRQHRIILLGYFIKFLFNLIIPLVIYFIITWLLSFDIFKNSSFQMTKPYDIVLWSIVIMWYLWSISKFFADFLYWFYNAYIITSMRLIDLDFLSVLKHSIKELDLRNIEDAVDTHNGILQTVFDMGSVVVRTASETTSFALNNVPKSSKVRDFIMDMSIYLGNKK